MVHATHFAVRIYDVDVFCSLRSTVLLLFLWQTASNASTAIGYVIDCYEREGTLWIIRRTQIEYLTAAVYGDALEIRTAVTDIRRVRSQRQYEVRRERDEE